MRRRYQFRWERVEFEVRQIERGNWNEPKGAIYRPVPQREGSSARIVTIAVRFYCI
jgi:hypothetical protein